MRPRTPSAAILLIAVLLLAVPQGSAGPSLPPPITASGFQTPESVLYDAAGDVYLVSNINGNPTGTDDNGFISRVAPDGRVLTLKWIDGRPRPCTVSRARTPRYSSATSPLRPTSGTTAAGIACSSRCSSRIRW